ncbi:MAG TPA: hypothetical protein VGY55_05740 [Pirellulales bacterium]|nr:hypothetical protein [Pirellulales bacterium]
MKTNSLWIVLLMFSLWAGPAWGHGFSLIPNSSTSPTSFSIVSAQPVLDNDPNNPTPGPNNLFLDQFNGTANSDGSYPTDEGFAAIVGPQPAHSAATFHILSPLYFSDGTGPAAPASSGTYLHIYDRFAGNSDGQHPGASAGDVDVSGSTSRLPGVGVSLMDFHELEKDLYIASGSSQANGEYGFAFYVSATFANGMVTTGPLVDIFATDIGAGGGFATNADPFALQDPATLAIFRAAVPEPSAFVLCAICLAALGAFLYCNAIRSVS